MSFQTGYTPKTKPGGSYGGPGKRHGDWVSTTVVRNHQITPRKFSEEIKEDKEGEIQRDFQEIVRRFV